MPLMMSQRFKAGGSAANKARILLVLPGIDPGRKDDKRFIIQESVMVGASVTSSLPLVRGVHFHISSIATFRRKTTPPP